MGAFTTIFSFIFKKQKNLETLHLLALWSSYLISSSVSLAIITVPVFKKHLWHHFNVPQTEIRPLISCLRINVIFFPCYITYASPEHYVSLSTDFLTICSQMTQHLHLALQQLTLIHLPASSLGTTSCPSSIHPLCRTMSGDYNPSPFVQSLVYTHTRLITRFSYATQNLAQPCVKTVPHQHTHTCTRPSYCWFTVTHNSSTTCWKVGWRSVMLYTAPGCIIGCLTVAFCVCLWILIKGKGRSKTPCETQMSQRVWHRGTLIGPRIPPKRHPT